MRIVSIKIGGAPPVQRFEVEGLSDLVVIAGPNGVGKSRLVSALLRYFQTLNTAGTSLEIAATSIAEAKAWGKDHLQTSVATDAQKLRATLEQNQRRRNLTSTIVYYESDRSIHEVKPLKFQFDYSDPWEEEIGRRVTFNPLKSRWQDTIHAVFKKIQNQKNSIATKAIQLKAKGHSNMNLEFADPLDPFREAFSKLLGPKQLVGVDIQNQTLRYSEGDREDSVTSLSSGEREVLNIIFDFILRKPSDCVIFFDEPELHLHPELLHKLIATLRSVGKNNQFFLVSHSPAVISASLDDSVIFLTPPKGDGSNQAVQVKADDLTSSSLHRLGQSIGVVALGRKIALIEGNDSSLDKQTYGQILANRFSNIVLVPVGGKDQLISFDNVLENVLNRTIWGVEFYMLADRDAVPSMGPMSDPSKTSSNRFRVLGRYHLENYFLDEKILASCFEDQEPASSWLRNESQIATRLLQLAESFLSYATALIVARQLRLKVGNISLMPKSCANRTVKDLVEMLVAVQASERDRVMSSLDDAVTERLVQRTFATLESSLRDGSWKAKIPGKPILASFAGAASMPLGRLKSLYISKNLCHGLNAFGEIEEIFRGWAESP